MVLSRGWGAGCGACRCQVPASRRLDPREGQPGPGLRGGCWGSSHGVAEQCWGPSEELGLRVFMGG